MKTILNFFGNLFFWIGFPFRYFFRKIKSFVALESFKGMIKYLLKDVVIVVVILLNWIAAYIDLFTDIDTTGGLGFFAFIMTSFGLYIGYLNWRLWNKKE